MPRSFDMSAAYPGSVEEVHRTFHHEEYWLARLGEIPTDAATVEEMRVGGETDDDASIAVTTVQRVYHANLPALVTQLHRGDMCVRREESWSPVRDGVATASIRAALLDAPVDVWGSAVLAPAAGQGGSRMSVDITVQVRVPLIGGKIEGLIGTQLRELMKLEERFTAEWMTANG
ncbi:DUF2505 domain-containing protein [Mycobacterium sp.]|uniref:DUF2505 domain-containing protein n=1 Tax=Mycobacterium sp. TaxID=1785 RepID=UPI003A8B496D